MRVSVIENVVEEDVSVVAADGYADFVDDQQRRLATKCSVRPVPETTLRVRTS